MKYTRKINNRRHKTTRKARRSGGDIDGRKAFENILSIGYEIETDSLVKLTHKEDIDEDTGRAIEILLNTNTNTHHISILNAKFGGKKGGKKGGKNGGESEEEDEEDGELEDIEDESQEEEDEDIIMRQDELTKIDAYNNQNQIDDNVSFLITNDMGKTRLGKKMKELCSSKYKNGISEEEKNRLYKFRTNEGKEYNLNFYFGQDEYICEEVADVEWVITYYKPKQSRNIILETLTNAIKNIIRHLDELEETSGTLVIDMNKVRGTEKAIGNSNRILYHLPNTNMYYLQSDTGIPLKDICATYQMTFTCKIEHIFLIMKQLAIDSIKLNECYTTRSENNLTELEKTEFCVDKLITQYNENEATYKMVKTEENKVLLKRIKNYIGLILFKVFIYLNIYLPKKKENKRNNIINEEMYLKNSLFFNSRHSNHMLYLELKKSITEFFSKAWKQENEEIKSKTVASIIKKIILQPNVLNELLETQTNVRKNSFEITNQPEKPFAKYENYKKIGVSGNLSYGDPYYSLCSYLNFFEDPIEDESNIDKEGNIIHYDWLRYKGIDNISSQMDVNDNVVFTEVRNFQNMAATYFLSIADSETKRNILENKSCNKLDSRCSLGITFDNFKHILDGHSKLEKNTQKQRRG